MQTVLVAVQLALLGEISARLRAIAVSYDCDSIHLDCYYDGEILEEDRESMSCVETELMAEFPESHRITHHVLRSDYPTPLPKDKRYAFYRKEPEIYGGTSPANGGHML